MSEEVVEVRCPRGHRRGDGTCHPGILLSKLRLAGGEPVFVHPDNLIELYCDACTRAQRKRGLKVKRVLHRYDFLGTHVETLLVER